MRVFKLFILLACFSWVLHNPPTVAQGCSGVLPPRLAQGMTALRLPGAASNLRQSPSVSGFRVGTIPGGERAAVLDGPVCADNFNWWLVRYGEVAGWTPEGNSDEYWLIPLAPPAVTAALSSPAALVFNPTAALTATLTPAAPATLTPTFTAAPTLTLTPAPALAADEAVIAYVVPSETFINVGEISVMNPDGSSPRPLITTMWGDAPLWSPDGRRLLFGSALGLTVFDTRSEEIIGIAPGMGYAGGTYGWSPDGTQIIFETQLPEDSNDEIFIVNADGGGLRNLTENPAPDKMPAFSPDGTTIAFVSMRQGRSTGGLYLMDVDGANLRPLAADLNFIQYPAWSPDGQRIALVAGSSLVILTLADNVARFVAGVESIYYRPVWSPDGAWIAFIGADAGTPFNLYVADNRGGSLRRLTGSGIYRGGVVAFTWDDAGRVLAQTADGWLYALSPDGTVQQRLIFSPGFAAAPTFRFVKTT